MSSQWKSNAGRKTHRGVASNTRAHAKVLWSPTQTPPTTWDFFGGREKGDKEGGGSIQIFFNKIQVGYRVFGIVLVRSLHVQRYVLSLTVVKADKDT